MKLKKNRRECEVQTRAMANGYEVLSKGWPDFLIYKEETNEAIFIEVKRKSKKNKSGLSKHQYRLLQILRNLKLNVIVEYVD